MGKALGYLFCCFIFSIQVNANLIQWDAFDIGDELAVKDESTGLVWLDLSQTVGQNYLAAESSFDGWEFANFQQVENLLDTIFPVVNFVGELGEPKQFEQRCANTTNCFSGATIWQTLFGSVSGARDYQTHSYGFYEDEFGILRMGGSYKNGSGSANIYGVDFNENYSINYDDKFAEGTYSYYSSFLLKSESIPLPELPVTKMLSFLSPPITQVTSPSTFITFALSTIFMFSRIGRTRKSRVIER